MSIQFENVLSVIIQFFYTLHDGLLEIFDIFTKPLASLVIEFTAGLVLPPPFDELFVNLTNTLTNSIFGDYSLLSFMLGAGFSIYALWTIISWIMNIIS